MAANTSLDKFDSRAAAYTRERVRQYNQANAEFPDAREFERRPIIERLDLRPGLTVCDVAAGGGYLSDGISAAVNGKCRIVCIENSREFSASLPAAYEKVICSLSNLALRTSSVDRIACLAGIHHQEDKARFFEEAARVLAPGGICAIGDVLKDTGPAHFLNESVDRFSDLGHDGMFLSPGEFSSLMDNAGLADVSELYVEYTWDFPDFDTLVDYCRKLFRMTGASPDQVASELHRHLMIENDAAGSRLHWGLVFAAGTKPAGADARK